MSRIHETAAAVATTAALLAGHEAQAATQPEQHVRAEVTQPARVLSLPQSVLGGPDVIEHTSVNKGVETTTMDITDTRPWASHFSQSPEARAAQTDAQRKVFTFGIDKLQGEGKHIDGISFQGFASDEAQDKAADAATAGLGVADPENVELANTRAHAVGPEDQQIINDMTGQNIPATYKPGVEVDRSDLAAKEVELARQLHMTPDDLMQKFNTDPASLPVKVRDTLDPLIADRHVTVEVTATRQVSPQAPGRPSVPAPHSPTSPNNPDVPNGHDGGVPGLSETPATGTSSTSTPGGLRTQPSGQPDSSHNPHYGVDQPAFIAEDQPFINTPTTEAVLPPANPVGYGNPGQPAIPPRGGISGPQHVMPTGYATSHKQPRPYNYSGKSGLRSGRSHGGNRG